MYNEKYECFKFYNTNKTINKYNFMRFFKHKGIYYIYFNHESKEFNLSNLNSRYQEFSKYFNKYYCDLEQVYRSNKIVMNSKQATFVNPIFHYKNNKIGDNNG